MHELYELKEKLCKELEEYGSKEMNAGSLEVVDKLAHTIKNLDKIIQAKEEEGYSSYASYGSYGSYDMDMDGGSYARGGRGGGSSREGRSRGGSSREGGSYARRGGRGSYAQRRDSMGRYSRDEEMIMELRELMEDAPDEKTRQEFKRFIQKIESM